MVSEAYPDIHLGRSFLMTSQLEERPNKIEEKEMANYGSEESKINPSDYDCQILLRENNP